MRPYISHRHFRKSLTVLAIQSRMVFVTYQNWYEIQRGIQWYEAYGRPARYVGTIRPDSFIGWDARGYSGFRLTMPRACAALVCPGPEGTEVNLRITYYPAAAFAGAWTTIAAFFVIPAIGGAGSFLGIAVLLKRVRVGVARARTPGTL